MVSAMGTMPTPANSSKPRTMENQGTVGDAAEDGHHACRCGKLWRQSHQRPHRAAKRSPDEEGGDDLAAAEAGTEGEDGEEDFQQERIGRCLPGDGADDDLHTGAVVVGVAYGQSEQDDQDAAHHHANPAVVEKTAV